MRTRGPIANGRVDADNATSRSAAIAIQPTVVADDLHGQTVIRARHVTVNACAIDATKSDKAIRLSATAAAFKQRCGGERQGGRCRRSSSHNQHTVAAPPGWLADSQ